MTYIAIVTDRDPTLEYCQQLAEFPQTFNRKQAEYWAKQTAKELSGFGSVYDDDESIYQFDGTNYETL